MTLRSGVLHLVINGPGLSCVLGIKSRGLRGSLPLPVSPALRLGPRVWLSG